MDMNREGMQEPADVQACIEAARQDPWIIQRMPAQMLVQDVLIAAADGDGAVLQCIPPKLRTPAVCVAAVLSAGSKAARYVPAALKQTARAGAEFMDSAAGGAAAPGDLPEALAGDAAFLGWACAKCGMVLAAVPDRLKTPEMCAAAVRSDPGALVHVPAVLKTPAMCADVWQKRGAGALGIIPVRLRTPEMHRLAVRMDSHALRFVPDGCKDEALCERAVRRNGLALEFVPEDMRTPELCAAAARNHARAFEFVPEKLRTPEMCLDSVRWLGANLRFVPAALKTPELCAEAVRRDGAALEFVPLPLRTEKLCALAFEGPGAHGGALEHVPDAVKTEAMCLAAVKLDPFALEFVPLRLKTDAVCLEAVDGNPLASAWLPPAAPADGEAPTDGDAFCRAAAEAFAEAVDRGWPMPEGCRLSLEISTQDGGRAVCAVQASDRFARLWPKGQEPRVRVSYRPAREGASVDPARALEQFAARLEAGASGMPEGMRAFCAESAREACARAQAGLQSRPTEPERHPQ